MSVPCSSEVKEEVSMKRADHLEQLYCSASRADHRAERWKPKRQGDAFVMPPHRRRTRTR